MRGFGLALLIALPALPAGAASIDARLTPCFACHGESGTSQTAQVLSLGGQPEFFLSVQLLMLRAGTRAIEPMTAMMKGWNDDDLQRAARSLAKLPAPQAADAATDGARAARATALIQERRCNFCHQENFSGERNAPRLAGQREDYLIKALSDYANNRRRAYDTPMADANYALSDADIRDLAHFLSRLK